MVAKRERHEGSMRKRSDGRWEVRVTAGLDFKTGKPKRLSKYAQSKENAVQMLQKLSYEVNIKQYTDPTTLTVYEWLLMWLEVYMRNSIKRSTRISYEGYIENHFKSSIGCVKLKELTPRILQELYNYKLEEENLSPKTIINMNLCLHKALSQAEQEGYILSNPSSCINLPRGSKAEIEVLTRDEQTALLRESYKHRYGVFIRLTLATGLRAGELLGLMWNDIDFSSGMLTVRRTLNRLKRYDNSKNKTEVILSEPKTKNSLRSIPLPNGALKDLEHWREIQSNDRLLCGKAYRNENMVVTNELGGYIEPRTFKDHYDKIIKAAGLRHLTFHALRHTFATRALEQQIDSKTLSSILGHASVSFTLDTYAHVLDDHKRACMRLMEDLYIPNPALNEHVTYPIIIQPLNNGYECSCPDFPQLVEKCPSIEKCIDIIKHKLKEEISISAYPPSPSDISCIKTNPGELAMQITL